MRVGRTVDQYAYNGLTTAEFGRRVGISAEKVRALIAARWFRVSKDGYPECLDIRDPDAKQPTYRIHASAVDRYLRERSVA